MVCSVEQAEGLEHKVTKTFSQEFQRKHMSNHILTFTIFYQVTYILIIIIFTQ